MTKYETCQNLLKKLESNIRVWGSLIDDFLSNYKNLSQFEKNELAKETPKIVRFNLMNQYLEHFGRTYKKSTAEETRTLIENSIYLISFDNFEYDYRETILRVQKFIERAKSDEVSFQSVLTCLKNNIPEHTSDEIKRFFL